MRSPTSGALPALEVGDLLAILDAGRIRIGDGVELQPAAAAGRGAGGRADRASLIRRRQTIDDQLALEVAWAAGRGLGTG